MVFRIASRGAVTALNGSTNLAFAESKFFKRNATAMAIPSSSLADDIRQSISVRHDHV